MKPTNELGAFGDVDGELLYPSSLCLARGLRCTGRFAEPPLCTARALRHEGVPVIAGRRERFAGRARISEGRRGKTCPDPASD